MPTDDIWSPGPPRRLGRRARTDTPEARPTAGRQDGPARVGSQFDPRAPQGPAGPVAPEPAPTSYGNGTYGTGAHGQVPPGPGYPPARPPQGPAANGRPGPNGRPPQAPGRGSQPYPPQPQPYPRPGPPGPRPAGGGLYGQPAAPPPAAYETGPLPRIPAGPPPSAYPGVPAAPPAYPAAPPAPTAPIVDGFDTSAFGLDRPSSAPIQTAFEGGPFGAGGTFPAAGGALDPDDSVVAFAPSEPDQSDAADEHHHLKAFRKIRSHAKQRRVPRWAVIVLVLGLVVVGAGLRYLPGAPFAGGDSTVATPAMPFHDADVTATKLNTIGFLSWAYLDRRNGSITGAPNMSNTSDSASMIKAWMVADYLRRSAERGVQPPAADLADLEAMVRDSDNAAADRIVGALGGPGETIGRLVTMCQLSETRAGDVWGATVISARDAVRMGGCLADGRAAGAQWTPWVLEKMRTVRGEGDFGIRKAFPASVQPTIAIKNGWALRTEDNALHVNCLAIGETWVLAVVQRYPSTGDFATDMAHVDTVCQDVVRALTA